MGISFVETSAKDSTKVMDVFNSLLEKILAQQMPAVEESKDGRIKLTAERKATLGGGKKKRCELL